MEASLQGAVERQVEAVLPGKDGEAFLRACASCGSMERKDYYSRKLMTSEGPVELPFRGRATLSLRQEPAGRASRLRPAAALQLLLPWKDRHAGCPPPACGVLRTTRHPGLILPRKDGRMVQRLELLLPGKDSPSPPPRSASMPCTCGPSAEGLDEQHRSFRGRTSSPSFRGRTTLASPRRCWASSSPRPRPRRPTAVSRTFSILPRRDGRRRPAGRPSPEGRRPGHPRSLLPQLHQRPLPLPRKGQGDARTRPGQGEGPFPGRTLCLRQPVIQRTNGRAERYVRPSAEGPTTVRATLPQKGPRHPLRRPFPGRACGPRSSTLPLPRKGFDWLANLFAAQLGFRQRLTRFSSPIHT